MLKPVDAIEYPDSDGTPMGENDSIVWLMACTLATLRSWFEEDPQAYVSSNSFVYFEKGKNRRRVAPDLYFVRGVENRKRPNFKIWEEGVPPLVVFEFTTRKSKTRDLGKKKWLYRRLGVEEYYLFDPAGEYLEPRFRAFRLVRERPRAVPGQASPSDRCAPAARYREIPAGAAVYSPGLGLDILVRGELLDFRDPRTGQVLPTPEDVSQLAREIQQVRRRVARAEERAAGAEQRAAEQEALAREQAARIRHLEEQLEQLRRDRPGEAG